MTGKSKHVHRLGATLILASLALVSGCVGHLQQKMIFPASREMAANPGDIQLPFEDLRVPVGDFETHAWFIPLEAHRGVVLFSHGNSGNLSRELTSIQLLRDFGFSVLAYDYGGYGLSTGSPSEDRCYADIRAMWDYLTLERGIPADEILLFGRSLGSGPTVELARSATPGAVILESPFLSIDEVAKETSYKVITGLIRHHFNNEEKIGEMNGPLLVIHSPEDSIVPYSHGTTLFASAPEPKEFLEVSGGHTTPLVTADPAYRPGWEAFLTPLFGPNPVHLDMAAAPKP